jgi:hypothetical protein
MFGVGEVVVESAHFDDAKAADTCGVTRDLVTSAVAKALADTSVPAVAIADVKPPAQGVARIQLIPEIYTHADDNLDCVSYIALTAENHVTTVIPPVATPRSVTVLYWRQHASTVSGQTSHASAITRLLQNMTAQFAQQYKLDQPPTVPK